MTIPEYLKPFVSARVVRTWIAAFLLIWSALPAAAGPQKTLVIESIEVSGLRHATREVIISESLLVEGVAYTETELRLAINRITRLPFVLTADLSLKKGSRRETYVLVISIEETASFFFGLEVETDTGSAFDFDFSGDEPLIRHRVGPLLQRSEFDSEDDSLFLAGYRLFVGRTGVLFAAYNTVSEGFEVGYTRYNLFGRNAFLNVGLSRGLDNDRWGGSAELGVPIRGNHSFRVLWNGRRQEWSLASGDQGGGQETEQHFTLRWQFDTRNDTLFATRGDLVFAGLEYFDSTHSSFGTAWIFPPGIWPEPPIPELVPYEIDSDASLLAGIASAFRYRPIDGRSSWSYGARVAVGRNTEEFNRFIPWDDRPLSQSWDILEGEISAGYLRTLWRPYQSRQLNDLRWRTTASFYGGHYRGAGDLADANLGRLNLSTALEFRNRWGVFRLSLSYRNWFGDLATRRGAVPVGALR